MRTPEQRALSEAAGSFETSIVGMAAPRDRWYSAALANLMDPATLLNLQCAIIKNVLLHSRFLVCWRCASVQEKFRPVSRTAV